MTHRLFVFFACIISISLAGACMRTSCDGLLNAGLLSFSTTVGFLTDKDRLLVRNSGRYVSHCFIKTIHELEKIK